MEVIVLAAEIEMPPRNRQLPRRRFLQTVGSIIPTVLAPTSKARTKTNGVLPVTGKRYLQLFSTRFGPEDTSIPSAIRRQLDSPPSHEVRDSRGRLWHLASDGLREEGGKRGRIFEGRERLPVPDLTCLAAGLDGRLWIGASQGLTCFRPDALPAERWFYFWGKRYLPDDHILQVVAEDRGVWARTPAGTAHITFQPYTLNEKSQVFVSRLQDRHNRYGLVSPSDLLRPGDVQSSRQAPSDNDGLWTSIYVASECFRYSVTGSRQAIAYARKSLQALIRLVTITGIPGFPAKAYVRRGDYRTPDEEWYWTPDHEWQWKGGVTNDELVGHFFGYYVAYHLLQEAGDRWHIASAARSIASHLLEHGLKLVGPGGRVPEWADYSPEYFKSSQGQKERAAMALELLSHFKVAHYVTGDDKFKQAYEHVAYDLNYLNYAMGGLQELPSRPLTNYSDEELAFLTFYPLLQLEKEPRLLEKYRLLLDVFWQWARSEKNPLWNMIYLACQPNVDNHLKEEAVRETLSMLERIPMETICWTVKNSQRQDLLVSPFPDRNNRTQALEVIPPNERRVTKWNGNPFLLDDDDDGGRTEDDGAFFLLPYWMGRYHSLL